jgi:hypothetical protein
LANISEQMRNSIPHLLRHVRQLSTSFTEVVASFPNQLL